jgi:hypothetical protein
VYHIGTAAEIAGHEGLSADGFARETTKHIQLQLLFGLKFRLLYLL